MVRSRSFFGEDFDAELSGKGRRQQIDFASGNILSKASPDNASSVHPITLRFRISASSPIARI